MKLKSHFNLAFAFDERSLQRTSVKNAHTLQSLPLYPVALSICVCSQSRLSQINVKSKNVCEKNLS